MVRFGCMICFGTVVLLLFLYISIQPVTVKTTLGTVAEKQADFEGCRLILSNAILGEQKGRFIRFKSTVDNRYDVVLVLKNVEVTDATTFRCYDMGLMTEAVFGCPFRPPFILLIDGEPIRPDP